MCERCCQCEWEEGQTVIAEQTEEGLKCSKCHKLIIFYEEDQEDLVDDRSLDEITEDLRAAGGTAGLFGSAVFACGVCDDLIWWNGPDHRLQEYMEGLRSHDYTLCPGCNGLNKITDKVREMLR